ncbi:MAG TPA: M20/M25/M40 family metallo-hydrolase [Flavobacteriales bacterium]|nr:M20/M25/M40 family metallo-hydrolase [Flavobacteriales bacterium]
MSRILTQRSIRFLETYLNNASPTGHESRGQELWLDYIWPFVDDHFQDNYLNTVAVINPEKKLRVVLEAHADEISWLVNYIDKKGFIYVLPNGGADSIVAVGKHVNIHTDKGLVHGVFGWPAIHVRKDIEDLFPNEQHLFIDIGASSQQEAHDMGVRVGDAITYLDSFCMLNKYYFLGRALDNRIGGLIIAEVARLVRENNIHLPFSLMLVNAVQEEIGLYGAKMIADRLKPDVAIVTDVTHDTNTPFIKMDRHGETICGRGPVLAIAPAVHKGLLNLIKQTARKANIPYQLVAISRKTGTDTDAIALSSGGITSALISPPLRYMHTPVEIVHVNDVENCILLMLETLKNLDPEIMRSERRTPFISEYEKEKLKI